MHTIKLIVGLANPGREYEQTRHNAGADYLLNLAHGQASLKSEPKFFGLTGQLLIGSQNVRLLIPTTFMNLSGKAVQAMANFYQLKPEEILVAHDELDLNPGFAKFKLGGGHGGHNGLKDIINKLGNQANFHRLRIGIGHPGDRNRVADFVLSAPPKNERLLIDDAIDEAVRCTPDLVNGDLERAMNRLNGHQPTR